jgi:DNA-binding protein H-NS
MTTTTTPTISNGTTAVPRAPEREMPTSKSPAASAGGTAKVDALPDLAVLPDEVLALLADEAPREQQRRHAKREADFFELVREQARVLGITPARIAARLAGRIPRPPAQRPAAARPEAGGTDDDGRRHVRAKYRNPRDHAQRWSGRGGKPQWVLDHLAAEGTMEELLIPEGAL